MSGLIEIGVEVEADGRSVPGFPYLESFYVDDFFAQEVTQASNGSSYSDLAFIKTPAFNADATNPVRVLVLMADKACNVRLSTQSANTIPLAAGGVLAWLNTDMAGVPQVNCSATTKFLMLIGRMNA